MMLANFSAYAGLKPQASHLHISCRWDYKCMPPHSAQLHTHTHTHTHTQTHIFFCLFRTVYCTEQLNDTHFKRISLALVVFRKVLWFTRKTLESCYLCKENKFVQRTDNMFRYNIQHCTGWSIFKRIYISGNKQAICIILNLGRKLL
jgi:hypothetical protein